MLSRFFIDRPIFAWVVAIVVMLTGALAVANLPIAQYPTIAPPSIAINAPASRCATACLSSNTPLGAYTSIIGIGSLLYLGVSCGQSGPAARGDHSPE